MAFLAKIIVISKFGLHVRDEGRILKEKKLRQIKIGLLCMDFVKIIKNKFKLKMTEKARLRMTNMHYFNRIPSILYEGSIKKARQTLLESLKVYMDFRSLQ